MKTRKLFGTIICIAALNGSFGLAMKKKKTTDVYEKHPELFEQLLNRTRELAGQFAHQKTFDELIKFKKNVGEELRDLVLRPFKTSIKKNQMIEDETAKDVISFTEIINKGIEAAYKVQLKKLKLELQQEKNLLLALRKQEQLLQELDKQIQESFDSATDRKDLVKRHNDIVRSIKKEEDLDESSKKVLFEAIWQYFILWYDHLEPKKKAPEKIVAKK